MSNIPVREFAHISPIIAQYSTTPLWLLAVSPYNYHSSIIECLKARRDDFGFSAAVESDDVRDLEYVCMMLVLAVNGASDELEELVRIPVWGLHYAGSFSRSKFSDILRNFIAKCQDGTYHLKITDDAYDKVDNLCFGE